MEWFVRYRQSGAEHLVEVTTPELAVEEACRLLDDGCEVSGIGLGSLTDSIDKDKSPVSTRWGQGPDRADGKSRLGGPRQRSIEEDTNGEVRGSSRIPFEATLPPAWLAVGYRYE